MTGVPAPNSLPITVLLAAKNEAVNLPSCLTALAPVRRVVVLDSQSTDATAAIAHDWGADLVQFNYEGGYPKKRQWALDTLAIDTAWVLLLDADEVVPDSLWVEIRQAIAMPDAPNAFLVTKGFHFLGRRMRFGGFSHSAVVLFRPGTARFERLFDDHSDSLDMEVHERMIVEGALGRLETPLIHRDFKGLEAYIARHNEYSTWEARLRQSYLARGRYGDDAINASLFGNAQERRRFAKTLVMKIPCESWAWFVYHYFVRLGVLERRAGLIACQIRASYINQVRAKMFEMERHGKRGSGGSNRARTDRAGAAPAPPRRCIGHPHDQETR